MELQANHPDASFFLAFVDDAARASVVGWLRAVVDHHGIGMVDVEVPNEMKELLVAKQIDQEAGIETEGRLGISPAR